MTISQLSEFKIPFFPRLQNGQSKNFIVVIVTIVVIVIIVAIVVIVIIVVIDIIIIATAIGKPLKKGIISLIRKVSRNRRNDHLR